jgi:hypothetical protein
MTQADRPKVGPNRPCPGCACIHASKSNFWGNAIEAAVAVRHSILKSTFTFAEIAIVDGINNSSPLATAFLNSRSIPAAAPY